LNVSQKSKNVLKVDPVNNKRRLLKTKPDIKTKEKVKNKEHCALKIH